MHMGPVQLVSGVTQALLQRTAGEDDLALCLDLALGLAPIEEEGGGGALHTAQDLLLARSEMQRLGLLALLRVALLPAQGCLAAERRWLRLLRAACGKVAG